MAKLSGAKKTAFLARMAAGREAAKIGRKATKSTKKSKQKSTGRATVADKIVVVKQKGALEQAGTAFGGLIESAAYGAGAEVLGQVLPDSWDILNAGREVTTAVIAGIAGAVTGSAQLKKVSRAAAAIAGADLVRGGTDRGDEPLSPEDITIP